MPTAKSLASFPLQTQQYIAEHGVPSQATAPAPEPEPRPTFVTPGIAIEPNRVTILVACETKSETNQRQWRAKNRRAGQAWMKVREAVGANIGALEPFARHYAAGGVLRLRFVRLGGRRLDNSNVPSATKGVEDAVAYLLNANDGDARWHPGWDQEAGLVGVRVEIETFGDIFNGG